MSEISSPQRIYHVPFLIKLTWKKKSNTIAHWMQRENKALTPVTLFPSF